MNFDTLTALKLSLLLVLAVNGLSACTHGDCSIFTDDDGIIPEPEDDSLVKRQCLKKLYDTEKYPYLVKVYYKCGRDSGDVTGVILSDNRVLFVTSTIMKNVGQCTYEVIAGADQYVKGGIQHVAESVKIGDKRELTLLKLKTPIKFGSQAKSIPLASEKPKKGDQALFSSWIYNLKEGKHEGIYATNITLIDEAECRKVISWNPHAINRLNSYGNSFCIHKFKNPCPAYYPAVLFSNGQLVGLKNDGYEAEQEINTHDYVYSFYDVAHYNTAIKSHM